jgi:glycogen debranching enzyme
LSPGDPQYRGRYTGGPYSRDGAYHQGTVWPWLMGPFITAFIRVNGGSPAARQQAETWLSSLKDHLSDAGVGHISEIFDGDPPHRPVGCIAQAWSVAEILRATVEDIHGVRQAAKSHVKSAIELMPPASGEPPVARRAGNE